MDSREEINNMIGRISFRGILLFTAVIYLGAFTLNGQLFTQLPTNWFISWLGSIFSQMDAHGFFNVWSGMTSGAHYLYFLVWKPAQALNGQADVAAVFSLLWYFLDMGALFLSAWLFYKIAEHLFDKTKATILGTIYLVLFLTFEWYITIDPIILAALLGAIYCSFRGWGKTAGLLFAISVVMKPLGIFILPIILKSEFLPRKTKVSFSVTFLVSTIALLLPFAIGNFPIFMSAFNWQNGRPPWETVYALFMWLLNKPFPDNAFFYDYSGINPRDWGWTGITPIPSMMTTPVPNYGTWYSELSLILVVVALLALLLLKRVRTKTDMLVGCLFAMAAYFGFFFGWSAQWFFWLAPFTLLCLPLGLTALFRILGLFEYPFFFGLYLANIAPDITTSVIGMPVAWTSALAPIGPIGLWTLVVLRTALILSFGVAAWIKLPEGLWQPFWKLKTLMLAFGRTGLNTRMVGVRPNYDSGSVKSKLILKEM